jgi:hypothetical protein
LSLPLYIIVQITLCDELAHATNSFDLILSALAEELGADNGGLSWQATLSEDLEVTL